MSDTPLTMPVDQQWTDIKEGVAQVCAAFTNDYWLKLDAASEYPTEFVTALTEAGYLGCAHPGGVRRLGAAAIARPALCSKTIHEQPCNAAACHAQMYTMGTVLRHGSEEQKQTLPAGHRLRRAAAAGLRRHRADDGLRHDAAQDARGEEGQRPLRRQRPEGVDQPRAAFRSDAAAGAHDAAPTRCKQALGWPVGVPGRPARGQGQWRRDQARSTP